MIWRTGHWMCALTLLTAGCSSDEGAGPPPSAQRGIVFVSGNNVSDSVGTELSSPLIVEVHDNAGRLAPLGSLVRFEPVVDPMNGPEALVAALGSSVFASVADGSTDASGRTGAHIVLPTIPRSIRVVIRVPTLGLQDTARFVSVAGGIASVQLTPRDTTIVLGRSYSLVARLRDRYGNALQGTPSWSLTGTATGGTVTTAGVVSAPSTGRYRVVATAAAGITDSINFSAVPEATIVAHDRGRGQIVVVDLDGSNRRSLALVNDGNVGTRPRWLVGTTKVVYTGYEDFYMMSFLVDSGGTRSHFVSAFTHMRDVAPTSDGEWVYLAVYNGECVHHGYCLHRVRPDGSAMELLPAARTLPQESVRPSPSPDGRRLAFNTLGGIARLRVLDVLTNTILPLDVAGSYPQWSPVDESIAFLEGDGSLSVVSASRFTTRRLVDGSGVLSGRSFTWSPDGQWILYNGAEGLSLVRAQDGTVVPLPAIAGLIEPSWR